MVMSSFAERSVVELSLPVLRHRSFATGGLTPTSRMRDKRYSNVTLKLT